MGQVFPVNASGAVLASDGAAVAQVYNGVAYDSSGNICFTSANPEAVVHNGFSMDSAGRIRIALDGVVSYVHNGFAFDSQNRLVVTQTAPGTSVYDGLLRKADFTLYSTGLAAPVTFASDALDDTSGVALDAHINAGVGGNWTKVTGSGAVVASFNAVNRVVNNNGGGSAYYIMPSATAGNQSVQADTIQMSALAGCVRGIVACWQGAAVISGYMARYLFSSTAWQLFMLNAGAATQLGSNVVQALTLNQVYVPKLIVASGFVSLQVDGATVIGPVADSTWTSGNPGLYFNGGGSLSTGFASDNFLATTP